MLYISKFEKDLTKSYTRVALNNIKALQSQNINFELRPLEQMLDWNQMPEWCRDSQAYFNNSRSNMKCALIHALPTDLLATKMYKSKNLTIGVTTFETSKLPMWLVESLNESYKGLIVPSQFNKNGLLSSGCRIPIEVVPHALGDWWLKDRSKTSDKNNAVYTFGFFGYWNPRKNPETLVKAYLAAFPKNKGNTSLLIKTFGAPNIEDILPQSRDNSDIWFFNESWAENQMLWGFDQIDCYVSPHLGEGFGLTLAQAAAQGKPCVYTDFSAPCEWLSKPFHYPIQTNLCDAISVPQLSNTLQATRGMEWGEPNFEHLVSILQDLAERRPHFGFQGEALNHFRQQMTWDSVGRSFVDAIENIMGYPLEKKEISDDIKKTEP